MVLSAIALLACGPGQAQEGASEWIPVTEATSNASSIEALTELSCQYPDSATVRRRWLGAMLEAPDDSLAGQANALAVRGYALSEAGEAAIAAALGPEDAAEFRATMAKNRTPKPASQVIATIPAEARLVEGIARDPATGDLYATTIVSRRLYRKRGDGPWQAVELGPVGSLSAIVYDPGRKLLWIASSVFDETPGDPVHAAVLGFDPAQGKVVRTIFANGAVPLGDIAVGADGTIYAANPVAGEVHMADPDTDEGFRALVGHGVFRSPQGMVAVPGTSLVVVSDYSYGLAALDSDNGKVWRITGGDGAFLDGIDALLLYRHSLIAVQNGHNPQRILKLEMADDWLSIKDIAVLESAHPGWTEPVGGSITDDGLLYLGTGQWNSYAKGGALKEGAEPQPTEVRLLPLP